MVSGDSAGDTALSSHFPDATVTPQRDELPVLADGRGDPAKGGRLALVAMPGGGKSTLGRHLAKRLDRDFIDSDTVIERRIGCSIRTYFEREGEDRFRLLEQEVIAELLARPNQVIATGGGVILREANRSALRRHAVVIYLRSTPEDLFRRLKHDVKRPLLQVADPLGRLRELHAVRDPLYRETAHFIIDTTGRPSIATLLNMILMQLELGIGVDASTMPSPIDARDA